MKAPENSWLKIYSAAFFVMRREFAERLDRRDDHIVALAKEVADTAAISMDTKR